MPGVRYQVLGVGRRASGVGCQVPGIRYEILDIIY